MKTPVSIAGVIFFSAVSVVHAAIAGDSGLTKCGPESAEVSAMINQCTNVATARKSATVRVKADSEGAEALEVTAVPLASDPASPYLVQVFVDDDAEPENATTKLLGSFTFLPARIGQAQSFVLPKPDLADARANKFVTLSIKLIPANEYRVLNNSAIEILDARFVR